MRFGLILGLVGTTLAMLGGCYQPRSIASMRSAMTPHEPGPYAGDPYSNGGLAATGAADTQASYARGVNNDGTVPKDPLFDQPEKGTGLQPGDGQLETRNDHGITNAPAQQQSPTETSNPALR